MRRSGRNRVLWTVIIVGMLAIVFASAFIIKQREAQARQEAQVEADKVNENYNRIYEIDSEISDLKSGKSEKTAHVGTIAMLFDTPDEKIDNEAYSLLSKAGYKPIITVSDKAFPGDKGMLSSSRLKELCDEGCTLAINVSSAVEIEDLCDRLRYEGLPYPEALFIENGSNPSLESAAAEEDIHTAVCLNYLASIEDTDQTLHMAAVPVNSENRSTYRKNATDDSNTCVYVMGFNTGDRLYTTSTVREILDFLQDYIDSETVKLMTPAEAYKYYRKIAQLILSTEEEMQVRINELEAEKEALFEEMQ